MASFEQLFKFKKSARRLEALPYYDCGEKVLTERFMRGEIFEDKEHQEWCKSLREWASAGMTVERVRVFPATPGDYNLFELEAFKQSWLAGEKIYYAQEADFAAAKKDCGAKELQDFWLLDDEKVLLMNYDEDNDFVGCKLASENIDKYIELYQQISEKALPLPEVLKRLRKNIKLEL